MQGERNSGSAAERITLTYMQQIFYFAVRKMYSRQEAEDFTQNVLVEILVALERGAQISNEKAWVWRVVRNHYAKWARSRRIWQDNFADAEVDGIAGEDSTEELVLEQETLALLYRELALLSEEYRTIVCAYYFQNRSLPDIANALHLPLGSVKRKIYECRKNLLEGMNMERVYGKRSFDPEKIEYTQNWNPQSGMGGDSYIERIAAQNILLEAYDNPCTAEELSLALGIAMPYMEEELGTLLKGELLTCEKGRYLTNIAILSASAQDKMRAAAEEEADRLTPYVKEAIEQMRENPVTPKNCSFEDLKLTFAEHYVRVVSSRAKWTPTLTSVHYIRHADGSEWALMGFEKSERKVEWLEVWGEDGKYSRVLQSIMVGNRKDCDSISVPEEDIPVIGDEVWDALKALYKEEAGEIFGAYMKRREDILKEDIPAYLHGKVMLSANVDMRKLVIDRLLASGYITLPADMTKSPSGLWLIG